MNGSDDPSKRKARDHQHAGAALQHRDMSRMTFRHRGKRDSGQQTSKADR